MKKYFERRLSVVKIESVNPSEIVEYRKLLVAAMRSMGATDNELNLIHDATIKNSIRNKRKPEDVAWAILQ